MTYRIDSPQTQSPFSRFHGFGIFSKFQPMTFKDAGEASLIDLSLNPSGPVEGCFQGGKREQEEQILLTAEDVFLPSSIL